MQVRFCVSVQRLITVLCALLSVSRATVWYIMCWMTLQTKKCVLLSLINVARFCHIHILCNQDMCALGIAVTHWTYINILEDMLLLFTIIGAKRPRFLSEGSNSWYNLKLLSGVLKWADTINLVGVKSQNTAPWQRLGIVGLTGKLSTFCNW